MNDTRDDSYKIPQQGTVTNDKKTQNTVPTVYPSVEFVNRTEN